MAASAPKLSVIIVTRDRPDALAMTLDSLRVRADEARFEVVVVANGSGEQTRRMLATVSEPAVRVVETEQVCLSRARNIGLAAASAPVILFLNDDNPVPAGTISDHARFHRERAEREALVFGDVRGDAASRTSPFMRWLEDESRIRWDPDFDGAGEVPAHNFRGGNTSVKAEFVRAAGGFDERLEFGCDDIELGWRLERLGARAFYDPALVVAHHHPSTLEQMVARLRNDGRARRLLCEWHPQVELPRRPGLRHRVKAGTLNALLAGGLRAKPVLHETWRFLCHEAYREACWGEPDAGPPHVRIGAALARRAYRDDEGQGTVQASSTSSLSASP